MRENAKSLSIYIYIIFIKREIYKKEYLYKKRNVRNIDYKT